MTALATIPRPRLTRLTAVELRKMTDTRAGFWLALGIAGLTVAATGIVLAVERSSLGSLHHFLFVAVQPLALLLPVMGVLLVTSEWSQRTALTTFTLVPQRARVLAAKLAACVVVALAGLVVALLVAVAATAVGSAAWSLSAALVLQVLLLLATSMLIGAAFGAAVLVSAPAIVAYLVLPTAWDAVIGSIHGLSGVATWLDSSQTLGALARHPLSGAGWAHVAASLALWLAVPLAIGTWRLLRRDVG